MVAVFDTTGMTGHFSGDSPHRSGGGKKNQDSALLDPEDARVEQTHPQGGAHERPSF
jgi:hypothetical protein